MGPGAATGQVANFTAKLTADTREFSGPLREARGDLEDLGGGVRNTGALLAQGGVFAAGIVAAGAATFAFANRIAEAGDRVAKQSEQLGLSIESFQRWEEVLRDNGNTLEQFTTGVQGLTARIIEASESADGRGARAFQNLGVNIRDANGDLRTSADLLFEINAGLQGLSTGEQRANLVSLLGESGGRLQPTFGQDTAAFRQQFAAANVAFSDADAANAEAFRDALADLQDEMQEVTVEVGTRLIPTFTSLLETSASVVTSSLDLFERYEQTLGAAGGASRGSVFGFIGDAASNYRNAIAGLAGQTGLGGGDLLPEFDPFTLSPGRVPGAGLGAGSTFGRPGFPGGAVAGPGGSIPGSVSTSSLEEAGFTRRQVEAIQEGSRLQFRANQTLEEINASLEVQTWDQMLAEIQGLRSEELSANSRLIDYLAGIAELDAARAAREGVQGIRFGGPQTSPNAGGSRFAAGVDIFRPGADATDAERRTRQLNYQRFAALAGREDREGNVQGFGITPEEQAAIDRSRDRLLEQGFNVTQDRTGFVVSGESGGSPGTLTVITYVGNEKVSETVIAGYNEGVQNGAAVVDSDA